MFWLLSKLFWIFAQPLTLIGLCVLLGLLLALRRRKGLGLGFVGLGLVLLLATGYTSLGTLMMQTLEQRHERPARFPEDAAGIIVLGGGADSDVSAARGRYELGDAGDRYVETLRLAMAHPDLPVLVTGGIGRLEGAGETDAASVERLFSAFGIPDGRIDYESRSRNTAENAAHSAEFLDPAPGAPYVLITSAYHMPRSVALFEAAGFTVVPWPVDFRTTGTRGSAVSADDAGGAMAMFATAMREWIGLFAYWATGRIPRPLP